jgi:hypothetical protein
VRHGRLYAATDVARFCGVDLTTIHAWVRRGSLAKEHSAGGQLRFRRTDVVAFLRGRGFPLPASFARERALVTLVGECPEALVDALALRALVRTERSPVSALLTLRSECPDALVLGATLGFPRVPLSRELAELEPRLALGALADSPSDALALGDVGVRVVGLVGAPEAFASAVLELCGA